MAIVPPALRKGDTIAIISPSARLNDVFPLRLSRGVGFLERLGFTVKEIFTPSLPDDPISVNAAARAKELHSAFEDPAVRAIICTIGGMSCNELLPYLDPEVFRANPKIFMGSSDITLLHHFLYAMCGLRSFYGPSIITSLGAWPEPLPFTVEHFRKVLMSSEVVGPMPRSQHYAEEFLDWDKEDEKIKDGTIRAQELKSVRGWKWLRNGHAEGIVWGGCLPSVLQLMGTQWDVSYEGKIMMIELPEGDFPATGIPLERAVWNLLDLRLRGIFNQIQGLIVGRPYLFSPEDQIKWEAHVLRAVEGSEFPVLVGVDVGHTDPMLTLPLGALVKLDSKSDTWEVIEAGVSERKST